jgi:hypothetical protein
MRVRLLVLMMIAAVASVGAQKQPVLTGPLGSAKAFQCSFPSFGAANWGATPPQVVTGSQEFSFQVDSIDFRKGEANIVASRTAVVTMIATQTGINLFEKTQLGNLNLTTIFAAGGQGTKFLAVHSRHLGELDGIPRTSQAYGTCESQ